MLTTFLTHQWKSFWRSRNRGGSIAAQVVLGFFMLYFMLLAVAVGLWMPEFIAKFFPGQDIFIVFTGLLLYSFVLDFAARLQLQDLPTLSVVPYLHLNIRKQQIVNFLNIRALFSPFNLYPFLLFAPFTLYRISQTHGTAAGVMMFAAVISLSLFNNYLVLYIKRKSIGNAFIAIGVVVLLAVFGLLEYLKIISILDLSSRIFMPVIKQPLLALVFPVMAVIIFLINSRYLMSNLYAEELGAKEEKKASTDYAFLNRFGRVGELAALELKLILRHKRSKNSLTMGVLFLFYGFLFYKKEHLANDSFGMMLFAAVFMTGISIITYGQFMYAWQSAHFDGLLANKIDFRNFIKAKFLLFTIASTLVTLLSSFYGFLSWKLLLLHLAAYLYNVGFGVFIVLYFANLNYKRLDLTKGASFNWQGVGATQWILGLPFLLLPLAIYMPFGIAGKPYIGLLALAAFGLITLLMRPFWINFLTKKFEKQRYKIAEGFRE
ncbi:hypothetical protein C7T94_04530 [Pedobacter yulinensis]|uniref:Uncharacterized protein n=1 Tax=Pedobacter yulinensis TaxID=2126353 RepID=A0A2T3HNK0_9SPHI|nr:DUF5687 family protein [Pedobacter yulinensis]PST84009.1 hypothetical protein C7T94_04530 [Pedobacter yulinensis]